MPSFYLASLCKIPLRDEVGEIGVRRHHRDADAVGRQFLRATTSSSAATPPPAAQPTSREPINRAPSSRYRNEAADDRAVGDVGDDGGDRGAASVVAHKKSGSLEQRGV